MMNTAVMFPMLLIAVMITAIIVTSVTIAAMLQPVVQKNDDYHYVMAVAMMSNNLQFSAILTSTLVITARIITTGMVTTLLIRYDDLCYDEYRCDNGTMMVMVIAAMS